MTTRQAASKTPVRKAAVKRAPAKTTRTRSAGSAPADADSPILPVEQLEGLRKIKPDAVDWVFQQSQIEAEHRRAETKRVNDLVFTEHLLSQFSALIIGASGIWGGSWVAANGQPWVGFAIATVVVVALAVVQVSTKRKRP